MTDPLFTETNIDIGTLVLIAEILRHERGEDERDIIGASHAIGAAAKRLGAIRSNKPNA